MDKQVKWASPNVLHTTSTQTFTNHLPHFQPYAGSSPNAAGNVPRTTSGLPMPGPMYPTKYPKSSHNVVVGSMTRSSPPPTRAVKFSYLHRFCHASTRGLLIHIKVAYQVFNLIFIWFGLVNFGLLGAVVVTNFAKVADSNAQEAIKVYMRFALMSVAGLAFVRFCGSSAYMLIRLFAGE